MNSIIRAEAVSVTARLYDVSLDVGRGSVTTIIGANGSGKSSLLQVLAGELRPEAGRVVLDGRELPSYSPTELARMRSVLDQDTQVHFGFSVRDVVSWGRTPWRGTQESAKDVERINWALVDQRIDELEDRRVAALSGGERKRVHIARVLAQSTPVVLLDEADGDLDLPGRAHLDRVVRSLAADGVAIVQVTHDLARAAQHSDAILAMKAGEVVSYGSPDEIMTTDVLSDVFGTACVVERTPSGHLMIATN